MRTVRRFWKGERMRTAGVICECNPLHEGHRYLLRRARESGADAVVCVMSGDFVQRGEAAILDGQTRAKILLEGGADLVLELPFPFCSSGADFFARAGVSILSRLGVNELWFGSECGDIDRLSHLAKIAESEEFQAQYARSARSDGGTAKAYVSLLQNMEETDLSLSSNDLLGISYLRAIHVSKASLIPHTVARLGCGYSDKETKAGEYPSATALRRLIVSKGVDAAREYLSERCFSLLSDAIARGEAPADLAYAERLILGQFRLMSKEKTERIAELSGGLGARMREASKKAAGLSDFLSLAATKKYPISRLQRGILFALTEIEPTDLRTPPAYTRLLAANALGYEFLASVRKTSEIPIVTRASDYPKTPDAVRQREWEGKARNLYGLCRPNITV